MGLNPIAPEVERQLQRALESASSAVRDFAPELVIIVAPDHYNGFFNDLMPPFCIGTAAQSVGDYECPAGPLSVDGDAALALATSLVDQGFDMAVSRRMRVDHGFVQPLQLLWGGLSTPPLIPIFVNAVAAPNIPRLRRCRALGEAIGHFLDAHGKRTVLIGSGGLSHEPPVPTLDHPDPAVRERITFRREPTAADHAAKKQRVMAAGRALAATESTMKPLNPDWDRRWMDALAEGGTLLDALASMNDESISAEAGMSAHESKNWLIARSALPADRPLSCALRHYQAIPEYIAGFGLLMLEDVQ